MSCLALCRVCLLGDVRIHSIRNTPLQQLYEKLTSYRLTTKDKRPETLCYNCLAQLQRYHRMHIKSQKSKEILTQLSNNGIEILKETVSILNRGIEHDYCITTIEAYNSPKYEQAKIKEEKVSVKEEMVTENNMQVENGGTASDSNAALCIVCLVSGVKTSSIKSMQLQRVYEKLTNCQLSTAMERSDIVCFMCHWQLLKCLKFINKSKKSESIMSELFRNGIQLTQNTVTLLNRQIKSNLALAPVETSYYSPNIEAREESPEYQPKNKNNNKLCKKRYNFECNMCNYKCNINSQIEYHSRLHDTKRRYVCDICSYRFLYSSHLATHRLNVHQFNYECKKCDIKFVKKRQFNMHMLTHTEKASASCKKCEKVFKNRLILREHNKKVHPLDKYPCERCNASFTSDHWLRDHVFKTHAVHFPFYICDICGGKFSDRNCVKKHIRRVHMRKNRKYQCNICKKMLSSKLTLNEHVLRHAQLKPYKCKLCPKTFGYRSGYIIHMKRHTGVKPFVCEICNKTFAYKCSLKAHYTSHSKFTCDICGKQYTRKRFLAEHVQNHMTKEKNTHTCVECGKTFPLNGQLKLHMYIHQRLPKEIPSETCSICGKQTKSLKQHMRLHTGEKPYSCKLCGKSYSSLGSLGYHVTTHTKHVTQNKPYACPTCGKLFKRKAHMELHESIHSKLKPYACEFCPRTYPHLNKLNCHMRKHREKIIFSCEQCGRSFGEKRGLDCHMTISHPVNKKQCYVCDMCFKVYLDKKALIVHIKTHKKTKPFRCDGDNCKKCFSRVSKLAQHFKTHLRDRKYACTFCKALVIRGNLIRHYRVKHEGITPYSCNSCDEGFVHFQRVYGHYLRCHNGESPYVCDICGKAYTRGSHMKKHILNVHKK